jgi:hypothetical protein
MSATYTFDVAQFRIDYPAFANTTTYPDATLERYFTDGTCYIANYNYGYLAGDCRYKALTLITAHLATLADLIAAGEAPQVMQSGTIGAVTVTVIPPDTKTQFNWWLNLTVYGQQLLALLQVKAVGGLFINPGRVRGAFRGGGYF